MNKYHEGPHKYIKKKIGKKGTLQYIVWKCMIPGCTHYIKNELAENRHTICWRCGVVMVLDKLVMELTRPHCSKCTRGKKDDARDAALTDSISLINQLFGDKTS